MNIKASCASCLLLASTCLPGTFAYIMGPDNRVEVDETQTVNPAVRQTGMIRIHGEEFVSGLLTGDNCDVVVSAGHTAFYWQSLDRKGWEKGKLRGQGRFRFSLDPQSEHTWKTLQLVASGYEQADNVGKDEHDWSIFRTSSPVSESCQSIQPRRNKHSCAGPLLMPGFHFDRPDTRLLDQHCRVKQHTPTGIIVHDCDSKEGSSGAPLICQDDDRLTLVGINISGQTSKDYYDAGVYGKSGQAFHDRQHKNFAIAVGEDFYRALMEELRASGERRLLRE